jgi:thiol-disulfide isomerase/thioredoxin
VTRSLIALLWLSLAGLVAGGTAAEAEQILTRYRADMKGWNARLQAATTIDQQRAVWQQQPDAREAARKMWRCIGGRQLAEAWTLKPAAWLLRMSSAFQGTGLQRPAAGAGDGAAATASEWANVIATIREAVETHHVQSADPGLVPMCMALVEVPDPQSLSILERIEREHPSRKMQGIAALGLSMLLKTLGDEGDVMRRRLAMLRKAIIESADVEIDGVTVAKIAEDELYVISHLSKGRVAPELIGGDVAGRPMKLSSYKGKVVVLLFWATWSGDVDRLLAMADKLREKNSEQPFELVGVNSDATGTLRQLVAGGEVKWANFSDPDRKLAQEYRVASWPLAMVIDQKGVIRYIGTPGSFVELTVDAILNEK